MKLELQPASEEDMQRLFTITSLAFAKNEPFWDAMYPRHDTEEGRKSGSERFKKMMSRPEVHFIKAVDLDTGDIAGFGKWAVFDNYAPDDPPTIPEDAPYWETEDERAYAEHLLKQFVACRNEAIKRTGGNMVNLDVLTIDPAYQRKGVGDMLVRWGVEKADGMGVEAVVESSVPGRRLYEKHGFEYRKTVELELPEKWKYKDPSRFAWMERSKKA